MAGWLSAVTQMTIADIHAIPDEKWTESQGGCTRPGNGMLADVVTNIRWTTDLLNGKESDSYNHMQSLAEVFADKNLAVATFLETSAALGEAIKSASDETLNSTAMAPWGMPTPVFTLAMISVNHVWYHDGQFNFVQCLLGDEKVYWMG